MAREKQKGLSEEAKAELLELLEKQGREKWLKRWQTHMALPQNLDPDADDDEGQEKLLRYLLLRVLINQQAKFEKVREMSIRLSEEFADVVLFEPEKISESDLFRVFKNIAGEKGSLLYRVGALGGIKPISLFAYRFKAYEGFVKWLKKNRLGFRNVITKKLQENEPMGLFQFLNTHPVLEAGWVGNDPKACRMFVNWTVFLCEEVWKLKITTLAKSLMIVDGHAGEVFCRTGLLEEVLYENARPYIIQASKMRPHIEAIVAHSGRIPFYIDNGAFYLFEDGYCQEQRPKCSECPVNKLCKKYTKWTAYQKWEGRNDH